ncbi:MAG: glycosyltransferase, partial [Cyclobacteriaceae bacterium]|nr:glycosyltransferase [Cyclobacteriaceae bacterium]
RLASLHGINPRDRDDLYNQVLAFAFVTTRFSELFEKHNKGKTPVVFHFHEWMSVIPAFFIKQENLQIKTVFTTHATLLGRYLAMRDKDFYNRLPKYDWKAESDKFNITSMVQVERLGAHHADVFTTVSEVTGRECKYLLGKEPKRIVPNGLNIKRFVAYHEVQNLHQQYKEEIHEFVMGHFFQSYSFDLDKTMYFFSSGRFEYLNKGFDVTLEALKLLNKKLKETGSDKTVVMFFITKKPVWSINPDVLQSRGVMEEIRQNCEAIITQLGSKLFRAAAASEKDHRLPDLNKMVEDYWRLRYRRTLQSWKRERWPIIVTHNLVDDLNDEILSYLRQNDLINSPDDHVKMVYHPDFINPTNPLFGMEYSDFVRGCHLGIFPSYYEPWGYTPLESIALGVPTVTSDLSGFGDYVIKNISDSTQKGVFVLPRYKRAFKDSAEKLAEFLFYFVNKSRRERMILRNKAEDLSESFDWQKLLDHYETAYTLALGSAIRKIKKIAVKE